MGATWGPPAAWWRDVDLKVTVVAYELASQQALQHDLTCTRSPHGLHMAYIALAHRWAANSYALTFGLGCATYTSGL